MWHIEDASGADKVRRWEEVKRHMATVIYTIHSATTTLRDVKRHFN